RCQQPCCYCCSPDFGCLIDPEVQETFEIKETCSMNELDLFKADTETFVKELGGPNQAKMADAAGLFIALKLRERSFAMQVITPRQVTRYDLQVSVDHDQLVFIDEKEVPLA